MPGAKHLGERGLLKHPNELGVIKWVREARMWLCTYSLGKGGP